MSEERLSSLAVLHIHKHKNVDKVHSEYSRRKERRLAFFLQPHLQLKYINIHL